MFPYGVDYGDNEYYDSGTGFDADVQFSIPYAGKHFHGAYVRENLSSLGHSYYMYPQFT